MNGRHVALLTHFGNGHVYSALGLCSELVSRGYRVTYPTNSKYLHHIQQTKAEPVFIGDYIPDRTKEIKGPFDLPPMDPGWWQLVAPNIFTQLTDVATWMLSRVEHFYENDPPDLILYDRFVFAGRILAQRMALPAIHIYSGFAHYKKFYIRENGICVNPEPLLEVGRLFDRYLLDHGIDSNDSLWHTEDLNIYFIPKQFQFHNEYFDDNSCFVGPCLTRSFHKCWNSKCDGRPIILVTNTTGRYDISYFKTIIAALAESEYHVILSISEQQLTDETFGSLPDNFEINTQASHLEILPNVALAISQGGTGNTLEPIYYGIPVIVVPSIPFHEEVAYRVDELGIGISIPGSELTIRRIRESVSRAVGSSEIIDRVKRMQQLFRLSGGAKLAADQIDRFLSIRTSQFITRSPKMEGE